MKLRSLCFTLGMRRRVRCPFLPAASWYRSLMTDGTDGPIPLRDAIRMKLEASVGPVFFSDLEATLARDAVFVVASSVWISLVVQPFVLVQDPG